MSRVNTGDRGGLAALGGGAHQRLTVEARREVLSRFRAGEPAAALAAAYGISPRVVAARLSRAELDAFLGLAEAAGYASRSQALRALIRMANGLVELGPGDMAGMRQAAWVVGKQGVLLNQLARAVHTGKLRLTEKDRGLLREAIEVSRGVEIALAEVAGAARRRGTRARRDLAASGRAR